MSARLNFTELEGERVLLEWYNHEPKFVDALVNSVGTNHVKLEIDGAKAEWFPIYNFRIVERLP